MKIGIIGGGGREHALAWKVAQSPQVSQVYVMPGNAGTQTEPKTENVPIQADNIAELLRFAQKKSLDLTIVGPEVPLALGVVDMFERAGLKCFGPSQAAAQLEASKEFSKDFLQRHGIPTAQYQSFTSLNSANAYVKKHGAPLVIKADGLAAGKGVVVAHTVPEALRAVDAFLGQKTLGEAGNKIIIEEFLQGEEASFIVMVDGQSILPMATTQDHKARDDGDLGPNTGGMGAYSPAPVVTPAIHRRIMAEVMQPTVAAMQAAGRPYRGFLYAGVMIAADGTPNVLEFNCRLGDPETQPIMMRLDSDLVTLCLAALDGQLSQHQIQWDLRPALGVVMAAGGYPGDYQKGTVIHGLPLKEQAGIKVFHGGTTKINQDIVTQGGRVLCVAALGDNIQIAQNRAYEQIRQIHWQGGFYRHDIGYRAIARMTKDE